MGDDPTPSAEDTERKVAPFERVPFNPEQQRHVALMRSIAESITATTGDAYVLKGGTALLLAYGLPRYSTDLDFDGRRQNVDLTPGIEDGARRAEIDISDLTTKKRTDTTRRHMLHYHGDDGNPLKVEVSYRQADQIDEKDVTVVEGIRVYAISKLAELKIRALVNRVAARDIFDASFLLETYPESVRDADLLRIDELIDQIGLDDLEATMQQDRILRSHDLVHVTLLLHENVLFQKRARGL